MTPGFQGINRIHIGTSGWVYKEWANNFYHGLRPKEHFQFYAVESIQRFIICQTCLWSMAGVIRRLKLFFAVKGSRYVTHIKRLNNLEGSASNFTRRIASLNEKLGPLLWQLPPNFKSDLARLEKFLKRLPKAFSHAIEFRHPDWFADETFALLKKNETALVSVSSHGLAGGPRHDYTREEMEPWARYSRNRANLGRQIFAYFNNGLNARAPNNANY